MSATITEQLYSQNHWVGMDGVQTIWNFTFAGPESGSYIFPSHVKAFYVDESGERVEVTITEDMFIGQYQLEITPAIPASAQRFVIYRDTPKDMPLVEFEGGSQVTEANLDRAAKQCIFAVAELVDDLAVLDISGDGGSGDVDLSEYGYKALKRVSYTGSSTVLEADNGKSHYKTDATAVNIPAGLPLEFLCTVANNSASTMSLTFAQTAYLQDGSGDSGSSFTVPARCTASVWQPSTGVWFLSGPIELA